jgi:hypothetical protein
MLTCTGTGVLTVPPDEVVVEGSEVVEEAEVVEGAAVLEEVDRTVDPLLVVVVVVGPDVTDTLALLDNPRTATQT